ncbi:hypothetical protein Tco_1423139, partial [Tanacetum coccineum]
TESESEEAPLEAEELQSLGSRVPLMGEEFEPFEAIGTRTDSSHSSASSDSTTPLSPDHPLTHVSPTPTPTREEATTLSPSSFGKRYRSSYETSSSSPTLSGRKRYSERESQGLDDEVHGLGDEDYGLGNESQGLEGEGLGLEEEAAPEGQQQAVLVVDTAVSEPLGLGYGVARHRALESIEEIAPSTYEVGQSSGSMPEQEGVERISAFRQPTLVTWVDPEDDRVYTDISSYAPPAAPVQTPPSPEWSLALPVSPSSPVVPSPIALPVATPTTTISRLDALPPTLIANIDKDVREMYTRPVLALEAWVGRVDTRLADMSWDRYDNHRLIHDMLVQQAAMQHELQEMGGRVTALKQERDRRE